MGRENIDPRKEIRSLYPFNKEISRIPQHRYDYEYRGDNREKSNERRSFDSTCSSTCSPVQKPRKHDTSDATKLDSFNAISGTINSLFSESRHNSNYKEAFLRSCPNKTYAQTTYTTSTIASDDHQNELINSHTFVRATKNDGYIDTPLSVDFKYSSTRNNVDLELPAYNSSDDEDFCPQGIMSIQSKVQRWLLSRQRSDSSSVILSSQDSGDEHFTARYMTEHTDRDTIIKKCQQNKIIFDEIGPDVVLEKGAKCYYDWPYWNVRSVGESSTKSRYREESVGERSSKRSYGEESVHEDPNESLFCRNLHLILQDNALLRRRFAEIMVTNERDCSNRDHLLRKMELNERHLDKLMCNVENIVNDLTDQNESLAEERTLLKDLIVDHAKVEAYLYHRIPQDRPRM